MVGGSKPLLTNINEMAVLSEQEVKGPRHEENGGEEVSDVTVVLAVWDVSKGQNVETCETGRWANGANVSAIGNL